MLLSTVVATAAAVPPVLAACSWHAAGLQRLVHRASAQSQHGAAQDASSEQHSITHAHAHQQQHQQHNTAARNWQLLPHISRAVLPALGPSHSSSRGFASTPVSAKAGDEEDIPRRRRRSTTESRAAMQRTTESRAAIEDVSVMSRSQLLRRNKPWLAEQCWQHGLSHEGLKEDLIQRLLAWQGTEAGQAAAAAAQAAAATARAAVAAATAAAATPSMAQPAAAAAAAAARTAAAAAASGSSEQQAQRDAPPAAAGSAAAAPAAPAAGAAAAAAGDAGAERSQLARPAAGACAVAVAVPAENEEAEPEAEAAPIAASEAAEAAAAAAADDQAPQTFTGWHAPRSAASAAADSVGLFLGQLQEQPTNAALVAAARNVVEQYTKQLLASAGAGQVGGSSSSSSSMMQQLVPQLAETLSNHSSPQSLAALAKACYSRELQNPVLAASLAEAVAAVAAQLGPQEVYGVLRLLVEHLSEADDAAGLRTMDKGFRVLAEAMIRCSEALKPVQLAEAVELLGLHGYGDAFGLWMIAKEAAARLTEFDPVKEGGSVVQLLNAIAGMCVADDAMSADVAAAVCVRKAEYSEAQLAAIAAALQRMGCTVEELLLS